MILTPHVDQAIMSTRELLHDVAKVGTEIGIRAARLTNHAILVVAECGALEPECTFALLKPVPVTQLADRAINEAFGVETSFGAPHIKLNAEHRQ